jgi:DNA-binding transcriptional MocR family regulator
MSAIEVRLEESTAKGLATAVSRAIRDGELSGGQRLPPIRDVARELALSPTTVSSAWALLSRAGAVRTAGRRGTVITEHAAPRDGRYRQALEHATHFDVDLSTGVPDAALLPPLSRALRNISTAGTPQSYLDDPVLPELGEALQADWPYPVSALAVVDGAMDALELVIRARLGYGDRVVVEDPTFPPLLDLLEAAGVSVVGVRLDSDGPVPAELEQALSLRARAIFLQPRAHNPTGVATTRQRMAQLAAQVGSHDLLVVEDDSAYGISSSPDVSMGAFLPDRTVHIRSFSKSHGPDLRLAAVTGPDDVLGEIGRLRQLGQGWSSRLLQRVMLNLLVDEQAQAAVDGARTEYARRRAVFCAVLADHGIDTVGTEGLNVWVPVVDEAATLVRLASLGIGVTPGRPFTVRPDGTDHVRVTTGLLDRELEQVAGQVAEAALTGGWRGRAR